MPHQLGHTESFFAKRTFPITLICDQVVFQANIGSIFRIAEAFGVEKIIFIGKNLALTPRKIGKTSRSTHLMVPYEIIETVEEAVQYLQQNDLNIIALEVTANSRPLRSATIIADKPTVLIAGSEVSGISKELLAAAHQTVYIDMYGTNSSMNVVQAIAIALYELTGKLS
jgi:tRNA G18 (ribose-2'-O)-methylase SpoU